MSAFHVHKRELLGILQKEIHKVPFTKQFCKLLRKTVLWKLAGFCEERDWILRKLVKFYEDLRKVTEWTAIWNSHELWLFSVAKWVNLLRKCEVEIIKFLDDAGEVADKLGLNSSGFFVFMNLRTRNDGVYFNVLMKTEKSVEYLKYDFMEKFFVPKGNWMSLFCRRRRKVMPITAGKTKLALLRFIDNSFHVQPTYTAVEKDWLIGMDVISVEVNGK
jgi:hypothetical protein